MPNGDYMQTHTTSSNYLELELDQPKPLHLYTTKLDGVFVIIPPTIFNDRRGIYVETYNKAVYERLGIEFVQDDISVSRRSVLRGIHGDGGTWKLISCLWGEIFLVVVDNRHGLRRLWQSFRLDVDHPYQILVPPMFGVGHQVVSTSATFGYKQSSYYGVNEQFTIPWNDPDLAISWPILPPILSQRDGGDARI